MQRVGALSQEQIREINRVNVINYIRSKAETTKQEVAAELGLSIPTVTTNINMLLEEGLVKEAGVAKSTGGRKPVILRFVENARYSFGVDVTPNRVVVVLINLNYEKIDEVGFEYNAFNDFASVLNEVAAIADKMLVEHSVPRSSIVGLGLSLPGLVDEDKLILDNAPNIGVKDYSFKDFEARLGFKVSIENEANVAAFAESIIGDAKDKHNLVYVSITEGVGTGIIINDHIYKSTHKKAGEFGHMRVSNEDRQCNCGRTGCWELYASKKALKRYYGNANVKMDMIFDGVAAGDDVAVKAVKEYLEQLFIGVENIILGLNPEYVIIGGELGKYESLLTGLLEDKVSLHSDYMEYEDTTILFSKLGSSGALMGAALLPLEDILNYRRNII